MFIDLYQSIDIIITKKKAASKKFNYTGLFLSKKKIFANYHIMEIYCYIKMTKEKNHYSGLLSQKQKKTIQKKTTTN